MGFGKEIKDFISAFKTGALTMQQKQQYELQKAHYAALEQYYDAQIKANQNGHEPDVSHIIEQGRNSAGGIPPVARTPGINPSQTSAIDTGDNPYLGRQMAAESGGRDYDANGNVLTSSAGAKGRMQVLDSTNSDPGYGVAPARDASVEERARVGRDYSTALIKHYGDPVKGIAAYNWGPGNLDAAMEKYGDNWLAHAPAETQNYVRKIIGQQNAQAVPAPADEEDDS